MVSFLNKFYDARYFIGALAIGAAAFGLGYQMDAIGIRAVFLVIFGIVAFFVLSLPYEWAICLFFFYLGFEGMAKLVTYRHPIVHVGSDIIVVALSARWFFSWLLQRSFLPKQDLPPLLPLFAAHWAWYLVQFANPYSLGLIPSLAGAKMYVTMLLLYAFGYYLSKDASKVKWFMGIWVVTAVIQTITGMYQGAVGPASVLSIHPAYAEPLNKFAGYAFRPFGTTHLPGGASTLIFMAAAFIVYFIVASRSWILRIGLITILPAASLVMALCQVRSAVLKAIIGISFFLALLTKESSRETRKRLLIAIPVAAAILILVLPRITGSWIAERAENQMALERTMSIFDFDVATTARQGTAERIVTFAEMVPLGAGMSRTGSAVGKFWDLVQKDPYFPHGFFSDNFWAATIAEIGIPGSLILTLMIFGILWKGWTGIRATQDKELVAMQAAILASLVMLVFGLWGAEGLLYNPEAAFFWFFSGVLMRLPRLKTAEPPYGNQFS